METARFLSRADAGQHGLAGAFGGTQGPKVYAGADMGQAYEVRNFQMKEKGGFQVGLYHQLRRTALLSLSAPLPKISLITGNRKKERRLPACSPSSKGGGWQCRKSQSRQAGLLFRTVDPPSYRGERAPRRDSISMQDCRWQQFS